MINYPNVQGIGCDVQKRVFPLHRKTGWRLTNFVSNFVINDTASLCVTGMNDIPANVYGIYPTPADEFIIVRNEQNQNFDCSMFDFTGRLMFKKSINEQTTISTKQFSNGIYLLNLSSKNLIISQKLIIQH